MFSSLFDPLLQYPPIVLMLAYIPTTGLWRDLDLTSTTNSGLRLEVHRSTGGGAEPTRIISPKQPLTVLDTKPKFPEGFDSGGGVESQLGFPGAGPGRLRPLCWGPGTLSTFAVSQQVLGEDSIG